MATPDRTAPGKLSKLRLDKFENSVAQNQQQSSPTIPQATKPSIKSKPNLVPSLKVAPRRDTSSKIFQTPMLLIDNKDGKPHCDSETLEELRKIKKTLNIVAVVGTLRTGKSFLLNKLAGVNRPDSGFQTGSTIERVTRGIWVMCREHPTQEDQVLVLLDTEGMDDPDEVEKIDCCVFILSTLLSSTMIYNTRGNFDQTSIDKFKFLDSMKTSVSVAGTEQDDSILDFFFPTFVLSLRDVTLEIPQGSDKFLEDKLTLKKENETDQGEAFNRPRLLIRRYFKKRKCFAFEQPCAEKKKLAMLMTLQDNELNEEFRETLKAFLDYIFSSDPKTLKCGKGVNGRMMCSLLENYVTSIQRGETPCIETAMKTMTQEENKQAVKKAGEVYSTEMKKRINVHHTPSEGSLENFHNDSMEAALAVLKSDIVFDDQQIYEEQVLPVFDELLTKFQKTVDKNSKALCEQKLRELNLRIVKKIKNEEYKKPTGYDEYMEDIEWIVKQYRKSKNILGTKAKETLKEFLDNKEEEEGKIYQWAVEAQQRQEKETNKKIKPPIKHLQSIEQDTETPTEAKMLNKCMEDMIKTHVTGIQLQGMTTIRSQYVKMLRLKVAELERVKKELSEDHQQFEAIRKETEFWKDVLKKAVWSSDVYKEQTSTERGEPDGETAELDKKELARPLQAISRESDSKVDAQHESVSIEVTEGTSESSSDTLNLKTRASEKRNSENLDSLKADHLASKTAALNQSKKPPRQTPLEQNVDTETDKGESLPKKSPDVYTASFFQVKPKEVPTNLETLDRMHVVDVPKRENRPKCSVS